eukprot:1469913-Pyramimonas_sp.AAC.1
MPKSSTRYIESCCRFSVLNSALRVATGLVITETNSQTSGASACRMQRSELGLLLKLDPQNYSCRSSHPDRH